MGGDVAFVDIAKAEKPLEEIALVDDFGSIDDGFEDVDFLTSEDEAVEVDKEVGALLKNSEFMFNTVEAA